MSRLVAPNVTNQIQIPPLIILVIDAFPSLYPLYLTFSGVLHQNRPFKNMKGRSKTAKGRSKREKDVLN